MYSHGCKFYGLAAIYLEPILVKRFLKYPQSQWQTEGSLWNYILENIDGAEIIFLSRNTITNQLNEDTRNGMNTDLLKSRVLGEFWASLLWIMSYF